MPDLLQAEDMQTDLTLLAPGRIPLADRQVEEEVMEAEMERRLEAVEEAADASQVEMIRRFACTETSSLLPHLAPFPGHSNGCSGSPPSRV